MVDEAAAFTVPCCVRGYHVYQHMRTPFVGEIVTTVRDPDNTSDRYTEYRRVHAAHCAALALRGIPCVIFLIGLMHYSDTNNQKLRSKGQRVK